MPNGQRREFCELFNPLAERPLAGCTVLHQIAGTGTDEMKAAVSALPPNATMPVSYDFEGRVIAMRMTSVYSTADVRAALSAAFADPRAENAAGLLFDIRGSTSIVQRTADQVRAMAEFIAAHGDRFSRRLALVADSGAAFGLMRLGAAAVEQQGIETSVFRDVSDAEEWLGAERPA